MEFRSLYRLIPPFLLAIVAALPSVAFAGELVFVQHQDMPVIAQINRDYDQTRIIERNESFDGVLLTARADHSLQFALLDQSQTVVWQRPARSTWVIMSDQATRVAFVGKTASEGYSPSLSYVVYQGVDVLDYSGNPVYQLSDTVPIGQASLSPLGNLLLSTSTSLRVYDADGTLMWLHESVPDDAQFVGDGFFVMTRTWDRVSDSIAIRLLEASNGSTVWKSQFRREHAQAILWASPDENRLLISEFANTVQPEWKLVLLDLATQLPIATFAGLDAVPFSADRNPDVDGFAFLLRRPITIEDQALAGEILVGFWSLGEGSLTVTSTALNVVNFETDYLVYDIPSGQYRVTLGTEIHTYENLQQSNER